MWRVQRSHYVRDGSERLNLFGMPEQDSGGSTVSAECPECGDEFGSKAGMHRHYGAMHGSTDVDVDCATCGKTKTVTRSRFERNENFFCDLECRGKFDSKTRSGEDHPNYVEVIIIHCDNCGSEDRRKPSHVNENGNNFCSRDCYDEHQDNRVEVECAECGGTRLVQQSNSARKNFCSNHCRISYHTGENHPRRGGSEQPCHHCGADVYVPDWQQSTRKRHFCSDSCYHDWQHESGFMRGENSPSWKGGHGSYYGPNWLTQRAKALTRDGRVCQDCGMSNTEHHAEWDEDLHVHHIHRFHSFDSYLEANKLSNLVALCRSCHLGKWELLPGLRPVPAAD